MFMGGKKGKGTVLKMSSLNFRPNLKTLAEGAVTTETAVLNDPY